MAESADNLGEERREALSTRFELRRQLGAGGMGVVYEALDRERDELVAVKVMAKLDGAALYRFKREFRSLADIRHHNLVQLYELTSVGNQWLFTMELIEGQSFLDWVRPSCPGAQDETIDDDLARRTATALGAPTDEETEHTVKVRASSADPRARRLHLGVLDESRLRAALRQLAEGLASLHASERLHLDIKPPNVLVEPDGRVVICDFGLVRRLEGDTAHAEDGLVGTISHMAPEQAASAPLSPAADWYAVGVMLYQALTGLLPLDGSSRQLLLKKQTIEPVPPTDYNPHAPRDLCELCMRLLSIAPEKRPGASEVLRVLGSPHVPALAPRHSTRALPFVGREDELARLHQALDTVRSGRAVTMFVSGPSGMGKSALVRRFLEDASEEALILRGRCYETESVPYKAFDSVIDALSSHLKELELDELAELLPANMQALSQLFPVLRRARGIGDPVDAHAARDPQETRRRAFAALRALLGRLAERRLMVISIEDLQWSDADSGRLLRELLREPDAPPLLLVATHRDEELPSTPVWQSIARAAAAGPTRGDVRTIAIDALDRALATELAESLLVAWHGEAADVTALVSESGGSPFFLTELARHAHGGAALAGSQALRLDDVLVARIAQLPEPARRLLEVIAVSGRPVPEAIAIAAARIDRDGRQALATLRIDHLARSIGRELIETYHDRVREALSASLAGDARIALHRALASAYETSGAADAEVLYTHLRGAGEDRRAAVHARAAADQAAGALAFDRAARLYQAALELGQWADEERRTIAVALGDALANSGRGDEAARAYLAAAEGASAADSLELRRRAAVQWLYTGHFDKGLDAIGEVLDAVGMQLASTPRRALASLLVRRINVRLHGTGFRRRDHTQVSAETLRKIDILWSVATGLSMIDTIRGADFQTRHMRLSLRTGEPFRIARSLAMESAYTATGGVKRRARAEALADRALALAREIDDPHSIAFALLIKGAGSYLRGEWRRALEFLTQAEQMFRDQCTGVAWELTNASVWSLSTLGYLGELIKLRTLISERIRDAEEHGNLYMVNWLRAGGANMIWLAGDEPAGAREQVDLARYRWNHRGFHVQHYFELWSDCQIDLYGGDGVASWERLAARWSDLKSSLLLRVQYIRIQALHLRARCALAAALATSDERLVRLSARIASRLGREHTSWSTAFGLTVDAAIAFQRHDRDGALAALRTASDAFDAAGMRLFAASSRYEAARVRGEAGTADAERELRALGVSAPGQMSAMLLPGLG